MQGRSVLDEAIAGSGRVGELHHELEALQHALAEIVLFKPPRMEEIKRIVDLLVAELQLREKPGYASGGGIRFVVKSAKRA